MSQFSRNLVEAKSAACSHRNSVRPVFYSQRYSLLGRSSTGGASRTIFSNRSARTASSGFHRGRAFRTSTRFVYRSGPRLFRYHLLYFGGRGHNKDHRPDLNQMVVGMGFGRRGSTNLLRDVAVQHSRCQDSPTGS
jgi:hypothetical protein